MDLLAEPPSPSPSPSPSPAKIDLSPDWSPSPDSSTTSLFIVYLLIYRATFMALRLYFVLIPFTLRMCTANGSSVENFRSEIFLSFLTLSSKKCANSNNITTNAHYEPNVAEVEHFKPLCA